VRRTIAAIGRTLVTFGLLILLFVGYQLWGTGIWTARAQTNLKKDFAAQQRAYDNPVMNRTPTSVRPTTTTTVPGGVRPAPPIPPPGEVGGIITIPKIGLRMAFVEGVSREDLKKGPGHYPETPYPGTLGNAAIAGHRTTYAAPFYDVDKLTPGDDIIVETLAGKFTYDMTTQLIVKPTDVWVVDNTRDAQLTLTSCNPKYSAEQRIVIKAKLAPKISPKPAKPRPRPEGAGRARLRAAGLEEGLQGNRKSLAPTILWGLLVAITGLGWWWAFRRWRHPATFALGVIPFLVVLFPFYVLLERVLPAGY
jgi:sortase A